jgi:HAD superfamily hydrolase (TIGR01490 family)
MRNKKELVIIDLDNVIIKGQSQKIFLDYLFKKKAINPLFYFKILFWFLIYKFGIVADPKAIMEYAASAFKDRTIREVKKIIDEFFEEQLKKFIFKEMTDIIKEHKNNSREIVIVSNAIDIIVKKVADYLGIKNFISTKLEIINGKFTGKIFGGLVYGKNKVKYLESFIKSNSLFFNSKWGYGDHFSDLELLLSVDVPIVVNPDSRLLHEAKKKNWRIIFFN